MPAYLRCCAIKEFVVWCYLCVYNSQPHSDMYFCCDLVQRSPFSSPGRAILKAMSMTTGDFDFDSLFRLSPNGENEGVNDIPFPAISVILWMIFIILMPILLTNMLVNTKDHYCFCLFITAWVSSKKPDWEYNIIVGACSHAQKNYFVRITFDIMHTPSYDN